MLFFFSSNLVVREQTGRGIFMNEMEMDRLPLFGSQRQPSNEFYQSQASHRGAAISNTVAARPEQMRLKNTRAPERLLWSDVLFEFEFP